MKSRGLIITGFFLLTCLLFWPLIRKGFLPLPSDIIVGAFHPWLDLRWLGRETIFPVKNFEIGDIVYQLYPWREFSLKQFASGNFPLWNPYNFTGTEHLANIFTASLYPLNILLLLFPFPAGWSFYIFLQPFLICLTTYLFLRNLNLSRVSSFFGSAVFAYSSIVMMRLEFGVLGHAAIWLPLALFSADKFYSEKKLSGGCFQFFLFY